MDFIEAIKEAKKGKKIRLPQWNEGSVYFFDKCGILQTEYESGNTTYNISLKDWEIDSDLWEVIEEKKETLSDKYLCHYIEGSDARRYSHKDLQAALKEFSKSIEVTQHIYRKMKEIFGEELVGD